MTEADYYHKYLKYKSKYQNLNNDSHSQKGGVGSLEDLVQEFFKHEIMIKMLHFQTSAYGAHKALDKYLEKFRENFDRFMESAQGFEKRKINTSELKLDVEMAKDSNIDKKIDKFIEHFLKGNVYNYSETNPGLLAIRDEMIADLNQLKYLLSFSLKND